MKISLCIIRSKLTLSDLALVCRKINRLQEALLVLKKKKHLSLATLFRTLSAPPKLDYLCINSTKRRYNENQYREITTANLGLATTNQLVHKTIKGSLKINIRVLLDCGIPFILQCIS